MNLWSDSGRDLLADLRAADLVANPSPTEPAQPIVSPATWRHLTGRQQLPHEPAPALVAWLLTRP